MKISRLTVLIVLVTSLFGLTGASASHQTNHPSAALPARPENDSRANAKAVSGLPYSDSVNNTLATTDAGENTCFGSSYGSVWYSFTPSEDMTIAADTFGSSFDTVLAIYRADNAYPDGCSDDYDGYQSYIEMSVPAGRQLHIMVAGYGLSSGNIVFNLAALPTPPAPSNDDRANAIAIDVLPSNQEADDSRATLEEGESSKCGLERTLWYRFTAAQTELLTASIYAESYGSGVAIYPETNLVDPIACTTIGWDSSVRFTAFAGVTYYFQVGHGPAGEGWSNFAGRLTFSLWKPSAPADKARDDVADAKLVMSLPFNDRVSTEGLTIEEGEPAPCGSIGSTTWYRFVSPATEAVDVTTKESWFDTVVAVYAASDPTTALTCNDDLDYTWGGVRFEAVAGAEYLIQVGGRKGAGDILQVSMTPAAPEPPRREWGSPEGKPIRPGASIGNCTANFIFEGRGIRAGRVYLGTAAHCVQQDIGDWIWLYDDDPLLGTTAFSDPIGQVAYSSFKELDVESIPCAVVLSCSPDDGYNDFALIEIYPQFHRYVHPSMKHFGGPSSLATFDEVEVGEKILSFGNSGLRPGPEQLDWHEGYVAGKSGSMEIDVTMTPGIFGDSGSPVILADGRALGVLVTLGGEENTSTNGVTSLQPAMSFAFGVGWDIDLCTSEVTDEGLLPQS